MNTVRLEDLNSNSLFKKRFELLSRNARKTDSLLSGAQWIPWSIMDDVQSHRAAVFEANVI